VIDTTSLKSDRKHPKGDMWVSEIRVRAGKGTAALRRLIALVRRYENLSGAD
jgi:hypothetical protein